MILRAIVFGSLIAALIVWFLRPASVQPAPLRQASCPLYFELAPLPTIDEAPKRKTNLEM